MKTFSASQMDLLHCLADGQCHSGSQLGLLLKVSRTAIWKRIAQLISLGVPIERLPQQGYRLSHPMIFLNEQRITQALRISQSTHLHLFASIDSTNRLLKTLPHSSEIEICCSEMQTQGRGRFGRDWYSPFGQHIYCSSRWYFDCDLSRLSGLALVVSLAVLNALSHYGIQEHLRIKWPNDVLWQDKKLCGSLIEVVGESNSCADVIIGIGINVNGLSQAHPIAGKDWCSLYDITGQYIDRNELIARVLNALNYHLEQFKLLGFSAFLDAWQMVDYLEGKCIAVTNPLGKLKGIAKGVNDGAQLILQTAAGDIHYLSSGDTSLHQRGISGDSE